VIHRLILILAALGISACSEPDNDAGFSIKSTALIIATEENRVDQVEILLRKGHDINESDDCGWTPLMKAALNGNLNIIQLLLQHGANTELVDSGGYTAMLLAASNNHHHVVEALLNKGTSINHQELTRGWTALIWAAKRGHAETVELLLSHRADRKITDFSGKTALDWAKLSKQENIVTLLQ
jgi:ankyrin repeat protein